MKTTRIAQILGLALTAALAASDQARRQLLADVSHELMTPLTAMRGYLETLAMAELQLDPPTRERYLGVVEQETRRMEHIVGDLLDLARLEGGGSVLRREFVDIDALFGRVAARHDRELTERDITLSLRVDPAARVVGDADRLAHRGLVLALGDHHDGGGGIDGADLVEQLEAAAARELFVHQDHAVRPAAQQGERVVAVRGLGDCEPLLLEEVAVGGHRGQVGVSPSDARDHRRPRGDDQGRGEKRQGFPHRPGLLRF